MNHPSSSRGIAASCQQSLLAISTLAALAPGLAFGCACGCDVFEVGGTPIMVQTQPGVMVYLEDDYQDQNQNWVEGHAAPAQNNTDKKIITNFGSVGLDWNIERNWSFSAQIPYWFRRFSTDIGSPGTPDVVTFNHNALGDIRLLGTYTGLSPDWSTGLSAGVKLATGDWTYPNFDRDTSIGTGTTDLLVGGYHIGVLSNDYHLKWFAQGIFQRAFNTREGYRPGNETDVALGLMRDGITVGDTTSLAAVLQILASDRLHDSGVNADPPNSGYRRVLVSPGLVASVNHWKFYGDLEFRAYHWANAAPSVAYEGTQGQLVAKVLAKAVITYSF